MEEVVRDIAECSVSKDGVIDVNESQSSSNTFQDWSNFELCAVHKWSLIPPHFLLPDIHDISPFPFTKTSSSDITKAHRGSLVVVLKNPRPSQILSNETIIRFYFEARLWSTLQHRNIIPFLGLHPGPARQMSMVSKFMANGILTSYLSSCPTADRLHLLTSIASAISYLHSLPNPVLHGDIRGANVLIDDDGTPYLTDFGYSMIMDLLTSTFSPLEHAFAGSPRWTPEEKLRHSKFPLTLKADVYSFACLCIEVFSGKLPFNHLRNDGAVVIEVIIKHKHPSRPKGHEASQLTDSLWDLLESCFSRDPSTRPSMDEVYRFLLPLVSSTHTD